MSKLIVVITATALLSESNLNRQGAIEAGSGGLLIQTARRGEFTAVSGRKAVNSSSVD